LEDRFGCHVAEPPAPVIMKSMFLHTATLISSSPKGAAVTRFLMRAIVKVFQSLFRPMKGNFGEQDFFQHDEVQAVPVGSALWYVGIAKKQARSVSHQHWELMA
jgi:hypothetical protein